MRRERHMELAGIALEAYMAACEGDGIDDPENAATTISDLIADLLHLSDAIAEGGSSTVLDKATYSYGGDSTEPDFDDDEEEPDESWTRVAR